MEKQKVMSIVIVLLVVLSVVCIILVGALSGQVKGLREELRIFEEEYVSKKEIENIFGIQRDMSRTIEFSVEAKPNFQYKSPRVSLCLYEPHSGSTGGSSAQIDISSRSRHRRTQLQTHSNSSFTIFCSLRILKLQL